jgi:hypothetical protein
LWTFLRAAVEVFGGLAIRSCVDDEFVALLSDIHLRGQVGECPANGCGVGAIDAGVEFEGHVDSFSPRRWRSAMVSFNKSSPTLRNLPKPVIRPELRGGHGKHSRSRHFGIRVSWAFVDVRGTPICLRISWAARVRFRTEGFVFGHWSGVLNPITPFVPRYVDWLSTCRIRLFAISASGA